MNEATFAQASALVAQQREALQDFQGAAPATSFAQLDERAGRVPRTTRSTRSGATCTELLKRPEPDVGGAATWVDRRELPGLGR